MSTNELQLKTVAVLGGSYGGNRAARILAAGLPPGWRVVLVDRNSHFNHVYIFPRYAVLPGHEHKAFIPYDNLFNNSNNSSGPTSSHPHKRVHGTITALYPHHITYTPHTPSGSSLAGLHPVEAVEEKTLHFDYAIYALGSHLPSPIDLWGYCDSALSSNVERFRFSDVESPECIDPVRPYNGMKQQSISWLRSRQRRIRAARGVLVVGGGALGIQFASDIAAIYPHKSVTLLHSRSKLLPRFDEALGDEGTVVRFEPYPSKSSPSTAHRSLQNLGVHVIFDERLDMSSVNGDATNKFGEQEAVLVKTSKGREIEANLVLLCTGQIPNTSLLHTMDSRTVNPQNGMVRVSRTMQVLAVGEKDSVFDEDRRFRSTSPTLCGTCPASPANTIVQLDSSPTALTLPSVSTNDMFVMSRDDGSCYSHTFMYHHLFAIGDAADAFGACKAGHTAYYQGEVAARNVLKLINGDDSLVKGGSEKDPELEEYAPSLPMIKVTLGLTKSAYQVADVVGTKDDETEDLRPVTAWAEYGYEDIDEEGMLV